MLYIHRAVYVLVAVPMWALPEVQRQAPPGCQGPTACLTCFLLHSFNTTGETLSHVAETLEI